MAVAGLAAMPAQAALITVSGANNTTTLENQPGTSDLGTFTQTLAVINRTTG